MLQRYRNSISVISQIIVARTTKKRYFNSIINLYRNDYRVLPGYLPYGSLFFQKNSSSSSLWSSEYTLIFVLTNINNFFSYCVCPIWDVSHFFSPLSPIWSRCSIPVHPECLVALLSTSEVRWWSWSLTAFVLACYASLMRSSHTLHGCRFYRNI